MLRKHALLLTSVYYRVQVPRVHALVSYSFYSELLVSWSDALTLQVSYVHILRDCY
jgi:hypothetical protein